MLDIKDSETTQQLISADNTNTIDNDSTVDGQINDTSSELNNNTIYVNMIFPS